MSAGLSASPRPHQARPLNSNPGNACTQINWPAPKWAANRQPHPLRQPFAALSQRQHDDQVHLPVTHLEYSNPKKLHNSTMEATSVLDDCHLNHLRTLDHQSRRELAKKLCDELYSRNSIRLDNDWTLEDYLIVTLSCCPITKDQECQLVAHLELERKYCRQFCPEV